MIENITIVTPAGNGGVRDYACVLKRGLTDRGHRVEIFGWSRDNLQGLDEYIERSDCIYVQYSGYGFAGRGAPLWMVSYLSKRRSEIRRLGVFFHELYAFGPAWRSEFWLSPLQRHAAARLARLSDFWLTNRELSSRWLAQNAAGTPNATLPVFSNVGELAVHSPLRSRKVVIFGSSPRRHKAYVEAGLPLFEWAERHGLELHDVGEPVGDAALAARLNRHGVKRHGRIEVEQVHELLSDAMFGIAACPVEYVAKSGVFAAYCAHGIAPVLISQTRAPCDGLEVDVHYLRPSIFDSAELIDPSACGRAALRWYSEHAIDQHLALTTGFLT